jgi:hypothetical protein
VSGSPEEAVDPKVIDASPEKDEEEDENKKVVISVRVPKFLLKQIAAYAAIKDVSANEAIRVFCVEGLENHTTTPEFRRLADEHMRKALKTIQTLFGGEVPNDILNDLNAKE